MAKKLKDLPKSSSRTKTIGQDPLKRTLRGTSLKHSHPALALEYIDKGPYSVYDLTAGSSRVVLWRHARCGKKIWVAINIRARAWDEGSADQGCYVCAGRVPSDKAPRVIPKWLQDQCIPDKRIATKIKDISPLSQTYWRYKCASGTRVIFCSRIVDRLQSNSDNEKQGCPCDHCYGGEYVDLKAESASRSRKKNKRPDVWNMFVRTFQNNGFDPERLPPSYRVLWKCEVNPEHKFSRSLLELYEEGCPKCAQEDSDHSLAAPKYRHIVREFLFVRSAPLLAPAEIQPGSNLVAAFRCSADHTYEKAIFRRTQEKNPENCPYCAGKRSDAPLLIDAAPYLLKRWDSEKNVVVDSKTGETRELEPGDIHADSRKKYWFICFSGHSYQTTPFEVLAGTDTCRNCALLPNCVNNVRPEITDQWDEDKNGDDTPWNTSASSSQVVWWKCPAGSDHEWQAEVYQRCKKNTGCPFCANRQLSVTNSLATVYPELAKRLHKTMNEGKKAKDIRASSKDSIWWLCSCSAPYQRIIRDMARHGIGCVACRKKAVAKRISKV